jgi:hypothetical protein
VGPVPQDGFPRDTRRRCIVLQGICCRTFLLILVGASKVDIVVVVFVIAGAVVGVVVMLMACVME